jgi:hypothetical protein
MDRVTMPGDAGDVWVNEFGPSWVDRLVAADPSVLDQLNDWWSSTSPVPMVGSRHHTVPRFTWSDSRRRASCGYVTE